jgi:hypothetical protein
MLAGRRGLTVLAAIVGAAALVGVIAWAAVGYVDSMKSKPATEVIDKYLDGYRSSNLGQVRAVVTDEIAEGMAASQTVFAADVKKSPNGVVKSWTITKIDRNDYIDQSIVDVKVVSSKRTYNLQFDIFHYTEGLRIRSVVDLDAPKPTGSAGQGGGGGMGTGMPGAVPGHQ